MVNVITLAISFNDSTVIAKWIYGLYPQGGEVIEAWCAFLLFVSKFSSFLRMNRKKKQERLLKWFEMFWLLEKYFCILEMEKMYG